jgi:uncharacterized integral membrane protein
MVMREEPEDRQRSDESAGLDWRIIAGIVVFALTLVFIFQNTEKADIKFLFFNWSVGIWFGLLIAFLLGALAGWFVPRWRSRRQA